MKLDFVAIDVETANADRTSICQIGLVKYIDGKLDKEWSSLINPEDYFHRVNIGVHGIKEKDVTKSPTFPEVADILRSFMSGMVCVSHSPFDRVSINRTLLKHEVSDFGITWLDTVIVARRAWPEFKQRGYRLSDVCQEIGYTFKHHDALEDAKACAQVLLEASKKTGLDIEAWLQRVTQPIALSKSKSSDSPPAKKEGNPEGALYGEVIVFTGSLKIVRREAADLAADVGCEVGVKVTEKTTLLVVGDQDARRLKGEEKSSKHRRAEELIQKGQDIKIITKSDFNELVKLNRVSKQ